MFFQAEQEPEEEAPATDEDPEEEEAAALAESGSDEKPETGPPTSAMADEASAAPDAAPAPAADIAAPAPAAEAAAPAAAVVAAAGPDSRETHVVGDDLARQAQLFAQDRAMGHIKPQTLHELYENKDTVGKIGTLFGLLAAGMGAGLTGQPNAVLGMMEKQIDRDLEAQKSSNSNAQNWYQLALKHAEQKAEIPNINARTEQTKADTEKTKVMTQIEAFNGAKAFMFIDRAGGMQDMIKRMPPGPVRENLETAYKTHIEPAVAAKVQELDSKTKAQKALVNAAMGGTAAAAGPALVNTNAIARLKAQRAMSDAGGMPPVDAKGNPVGMDAVQAEKATTEANQVNRNRMAYDNIKRSFEDLDKHYFADKLNEGNYNAVKVHLVGQLEGAGFTKDVASEMAEASLPKWNDYGKTRQTKATQLWEQFKQNEEGSGTLDAFDLRPKFPAPPMLVKGNKPESQGVPGLVDRAVDKAKEVGEKVIGTVMGKKSTATAASKVPPDGTTGMANGKPVVVRGGKWVPK